jgi:FkbM family methyltransferase
MKRTDRVKLEFTRNWKLPGKERLSNLLKPSGELKVSIRNGIVWLTGEDIAIYTSADSYIEWTILTTGTYENEINKLIRISLKPGDNALDIGGNIGLQTLRMSQCAGKTGQVTAFEPLGYLREKFSRNMALNRAENVSLLPYALSDEEGEAEFTIDKGVWNQGTFSLNKNGGGGDKEQVTIKIADELAEVKKLEALHLVKIDVEGFELHVLRGLKQTLQKHRPRIIFEYDENYWQKTGQHIAECFLLLQGMNYTLYQVTAVGCTLLTEASQAEGGNLFCIPS